MVVVVVVVVVVMVFHIKKRFACCKTPWHVLQHSDTFDRDIAEDDKMLDGPQVLQTVIECDVLYAIHQHLQIHGNIKSDFISFRQKSARWTEGCDTPISGWITNINDVFTVCIYDTQNI